MASFILIASLITAAALAMLVMPLIKTRNTISYERHAQNIHYAKERLEELEDQLKNASISAADYESLKLEIETNLADDIDLAKQSGEPQSVTPRRSNKLAIASICVCIPVLALIVYTSTGTLKAFDPEQTKERPSAEKVQQLIKGIETKLEENPDDLEGWTLLARTYLRVGRYKDARIGYLRVIQLGGQTSVNYTALADATASAANGEITAEAMSYLEQALKINPNNQQALWLSGLGSAQKGDNAAVRLHWNKLASLLDDLPQRQRELQKIIAETLAETPDASNAPSTQSTQSAPVSLKVSVKLSPAMQALANPEDVVFVFARAQSGPPAPLAVERLTVADLPTTVELSDSDAMVPQLTLSKFEDVSVVARVSKSGQPIAQSGDIQSEAVNVKNSSEQLISLEISVIVE